MRTACAATRTSSGAANQAPGGVIGIRRTSYAFMPASLPATCSRRLSTLPQPHTPWRVSAHASTRGGVRGRFPPRTCPRAPPLASHGSAPPALDPLRREELGLPAGLDDGSQRDGPSCVVAR